MLYPDAKQSRRSPWLLHSLVPDQGPDFTHESGPCSLLAGDGMRVCNVPGCYELQPEPRCAEHRRTREQRRGSREERGYDRRHRKERERWEPKVASGKLTCWRCGQRLSPLEPWDLGHVDTDGLPRDRQQRLPECLPCNRATSSR